MKYILHYVGIMNRGGMETVIMNLYRNIDRSKYQFHFAVHGTNKGDFDDEIKFLGGEIIHFPNFRENPLNYKKSWNDFWNEKKDFYEVFHYHTNSLANISAIKSASSFDMNRIIIHAHSSYANKGKMQIIHDLVHKKNQKYLLRKEFNFIAVSDKAAKWLFGSQLTDSKRVKIINNGINYSEFFPDDVKRKRLRLKFGATERSIIFGHVGNFLPVKNHKFLLEIFSEYHKKNPDSFLVLLGDGYLKEEIQNSAKLLKIQNRVFFMGSVGNVSDYLNALDIFVFPSFYEGLGLSLVEAQVNQIPVLFSDSISDEVVISEKAYSNSINVSPEKWALQINSILKDDNIKMKSKLDGKFDVGSFVNEITKIYEEDIK